MSGQSLSRRELLVKALQIGGLLGVAKTLPGCSNGHYIDHGTSNLDNLGPLMGPDSNGLLLPAGFSSRVVGRSGEKVQNSDYSWHGAPDGGACFSGDDGGWIYVSNSEIKEEAMGGVGAIIFSATGDIVSAYSILTGSSHNCAGGATPWGTWLSCEEKRDTGRVFECDPYGENEAVERPALGYFKHEAVAYDLQNHQLYLTEDEPEGRLYRFTPDSLNSEGYANLDAGVLDVLELVDADTGAIVWHRIDDPAGLQVPLMYQVSISTAFAGGEGVAYYDGTVYFSTKGDDRIWEIDIANQSLKVIYDGNDDFSVLTGVDNITMSAAGDILVAEDGGDMQVVAITAKGNVRPLVQVEGHPGSEITGPAFSPDQTRLYFSSQRGPNNNSGNGVTYEIAGPFFK